MSDDQIINQNEALIREYDYRISRLSTRLRNLQMQKEELKRDQQDRNAVYEKAVGAKRGLSNTIDNMIHYSRMNRQKIDSRVKILRNMYDYLEREARSSKLANQFDNFDSVAKTVQNVSRSVESQIGDLDRQILQTENELHDLKNKRWAALNG